MPFLKPNLFGCGKSTFRRFLAAALSASGSRALAGAVCVCVALIAVVPAAAGDSTIDIIGLKAPGGVRAHMKASQRLLDESFEGGWPQAPWTIKHSEGAADVDWGRSTLRASVGTHSIFCAGGGSDAPESGGTVPPNTASWAIVGPFDLEEAASGTLSFDLWLRTERFNDIFMWLASIDGENFSGRGTSSDTSGWKTFHVDLTDWERLGDLTGKNLVWFAFVYISDHNNEYPGAYLDLVKIETDAGSQATITHTYTNNEQWDQGAALGTEASNNKLQLTSGWSAYPQIWIANTNSGTVSLMKTNGENIGAEIARYRTGPSTEDPQPSTIAVDLDGSCWVTNRAIGSVVKIALAENGDCIDRNNNGVIDTSVDADEDGDITGDEILDWGADECVIYEFTLVDGQERSYTPGESHSDYLDTDLRAIAVDADNIVWVGAADSSKFFKINGDSGAILDSVDLSESESRPFDAIVDRNGILWSSNWPDHWLSRIDRGELTATTLDLEQSSRDLAVNGENQLYVSGWEDSSLSLVNTESTEVEGRLIAPWQADGLAIGPDFNVWVASSGTNTVSRYSRAGNLIRSFSVGNGPTGVSIDSDGMLWVSGSTSPTIIRINPFTGVADYQRVLVDSGVHDGIGDMTGFAARNLTVKHGTWRVTFDSEVDDTVWGKLTWNSDEPEGSAIEVSVRSSQDRLSWSPWEKAVNAEDLQATPAGRYLGIKVALQQSTADSSPLLKDLTLESVVLEEEPEADFNFNPVEPVVAQTINFIDASSNNPSSWSWDFGDSTTSTLSNPTHVYEQAGEMTVTLDVANGAGSDSISKTVVVSELAATCTLSCSVSAPHSGQVDESLDFQATATATECQGAVAYSWSFGDQTTSSEQNPQHAYSQTGLYSWSMTATVDNQSCTQTGTLNISGEGPESCNSTYWVPVVIHAGGSNDSLWRSDLALLNIGDTDAAVELRLHGSESPVKTVVNIDAQGILDIIDVVGLMVPDAEARGALEVCSDTDLVVTSRAYNQYSDNDAFKPGGTLGQRVEAFVSSDGLATGDSVFLPQLRENSAFRSNIGFVNAGETEATVAVSLRDASGIEIGSFERVLAPAEWSQDNRSFSRHADAENLDSGWARVTVVAGNGIVVYGSVVDNITNDPTTVPMRR